MHDTLSSAEPPHQVSSAPRWNATADACLIAAIQLLGGLAILIGFATRWIAALFVVYLILVVYFAHNFWDMQAAARGANMAHFYKNLAIMGGFLLLALQGAGRLSADGYMSGNKETAARS